MDEKIFLESHDDPAELQRDVSEMVRSAFFKVLNESRSGFHATDEVVEDISSQILIEILSKEIRTSLEVGTRIRTLCFQELNHMKKNLTGQHLVNDEGKESPFEGPRGGVNDLRLLEDVCDEECGAGMSFNPNALLESDYAQQDRDNQRIREQYMYFAKELRAIYQSLDSDFLKRFFVEWLVNGGDIRTLSRMIRIVSERREHVTTRRVAQCRDLIIENASGMCDADKGKIDSLFSCAPVVFAKLAEFEGKTAATVFSDMETEDGCFEKFAKVDMTQIMDAARRATEMLYVEDFFPELLPADDAKRRQIEAVVRLESGLEAFVSDPALFCVGEVQSLYPHQREILTDIVEHCVAAVDGEDQIFLADIAPPSAGKTYMQAVLARLTGLPFVFVTPSNAILTGPDGALATFKKVFPRSALGVVNNFQKEFGRIGTLTTYSSFISRESLRDMLMQRSCDVPLLFLLDEGDLAQSDLRKSVIRAIQYALHYPIICAFSATTTVHGRHLGEVADIIDEMGLIELIKQKKAKHILGFYVSAQVTIERKNLVTRRDEQVADFETLKDVEREAFVATPLKLITENHPGEQGIIHCMSVRHAELVAQRLVENGVKAACVSGKSHREQRVMIQKYIDGEINVLTSCDYLARGFSEYGVTQYVIFASLTSSVTSLYHKVGRGFRPHRVNKVLTIYQMLPTDMRVRNFMPALLSNLFPVDNTVPIATEMNMHDMRAHLIELIEKGEIEFIGAVGERPISDAGIKYVTRVEVEKIIDTLEKLQDNHLQVDANNIDGLFRPIVDAFIEALGGDFEAVNSGRRFFCQEVVVAGKKIKGQRFLRIIMRIVGGHHEGDMSGYFAIGAEIVRRWYRTGIRPDPVFIDTRLAEADEARKEWLKLDASNLDGLFRPIMDGIIAVAGKDPGDVSWMRWRRLLKLPEIDIGGKKISANRFLYIAMAILFKMTQEEASRYKGLGVELLQEWYQTGRRPSEDRIQKGLTAEQAERKTSLDLTEGNIGEYFLSVMDAFCEKAGEKRGEWDWIRIHKIAKVEVEVEGKNINGLRFVTGVCAILCGISAAEAQKIQGVSIAIVREWYRTGERPSRKWCLDRKADQKTKIAQRLKVTPENIDALFVSVMDALIEVSGSSSGDCEWMNYMRLNGLEVSLDGKLIKGQAFSNQVFTALTGLPYGESAKYRGMTGELMREWYKTGKRPDKAMVDEMLQAPSRTRFMRG